MDGMFFFDKDYDYSGMNNLVILHKREDHFNVINKIKDYKYNDEFDMTANIAGEYYEVKYFYKEKPQYKQVSYLREVLAPYKVNGQPRGWFYDYNGTPVRYSCLGNSFYVDSIEDAEFILRKCFQLKDCYKTNIKIKNKSTKKYNFIYYDEEEKYAKIVASNPWR